MNVLTHHQMALNKTQAMAIILTPSQYVTPIDVQIHALVSLVEMGSQAGAPSSHLLCINFNSKVTEGGHEMK